jgi:hypothetical protein
MAFHSFLSSPPSRFASRAAASDAESTGTLGIGVFVIAG